MTSSNRVATAVLFANASAAGRSRRSEPVALQKRASCRTYCGKAWSAALPLGAAMAALLVALMAGAGGPGAQASGGDPGTELPQLHFELRGPNDGEPINARYVKLLVRTNYAEFAALSVTINGAYLYSRSLQALGETDPETNLLLAEIDVDLYDAEMRLGLDLDGPEALAVRVLLYDALTGHLVAYDDWTGTLARPSMEFVVPDEPQDGVVTIPDADKDGAGGGAQSPWELRETPPGKIPTLVRTVSGDAFALIFTSPDAELLSLSPEDPQILMEASCVLATTCESLVRAGGLVFLEPGDPAAEADTFVVIWTYDPVGGWKRSAIAPLPTNP